MIERSDRANPPEPSDRTDAREENTFVVDAELIGQLLRIPAPRVPTLMREGSITSACERGVDDHEGKFRLTFFHRNRRARLSTDVTGRVLGRSVIDFGERPIPRALNRAGD